MLSYFDCSLSRVYIPRLGSTLHTVDNLTVLSFKYSDSSNSLTMFPSRQYKKVSQNSDSDSEDEVLLYAAPLKGKGSGDEQFGSGSYNRDLRLNLHSPTHLQDKIKERKSERRHLLYSALFCAAIVVIVLGLGVTIVVYAQVYLKPTTDLPTTDLPTTDLPTTDLPTTDLPTTDPLCVQPPPPLANKGNGCVSTTNKPTTEEVITDSNYEDTVSTGSSQGEATEPPDSEADSTSPDPQTTDDDSAPNKEVTMPTPDPQTTDEDSAPNKEVTMPTPDPQTTDEDSAPNKEVTMPTTHEDSSEMDDLTDATESVQTDPLCVHPPPPLTNKGNGCTGTIQSDSTTQASQLSSTAPEGNTAPPSITETGRPKEDHTVTPSSLTPTQEKDHTVTPPSLTPTHNNDHAVTPPSLTPTHDDGHTVTPPSLTPTNGINWTREFFPAATECTLQLYDMNRDGVFDVLTTQVFNPCALKILAMDGVTGKTVWEAEANFPVFAVRCELDINQDGVMDCIASGRTGGFTALNGVDGTVLWVVDDNLTFPGYNYFFPLIVDDLDSDGVSDLINMHGGDSTYNPEIKDRSPGFLVAVSGRTGAKLMDPILTPDGHETYMSPVLFKMDGKFELILFGTGGETVSGSLWAVSLDSIRTRILISKFSKNKDPDERVHTDRPCPMASDELDAIRPTFNTKAFDFTRMIASNDKSYLRLCPKVKGHSPIWNVYDICLYQILSSKSKGVLLPPVILDLNADTVDDLLVTTFDNHYIAFDGKDLTTVLWNTFYQNSESYR